MSSTIGVRPADWEGEIRPESAGRVWWRLSSHSRQTYNLPGPLANRSLMRSGQGPSLPYYSTEAALHNRLCSIWWCVPLPESQDSGFGAGGLCLRPQSSHVFLAWGVLPHKVQIISPACHAPCSEWQTIGEIGWRMQSGGNLCRLLPLLCRFLQLRLRRKMRKMLRFVIERLASLKRGVNVGSEMIMEAQRPNQCIKRSSLRGPFLFPSLLCGTRPSS